MLLFWLGIGAAHAFCGTFVGPVGSAFENEASQAILVRDGSHNTLSLANSFTGDVSDFGLLIPVPEILTAQDVSVIDQELFAEVEAYSAPRLVSYSCDDFMSRSDSGAPNAEEGGSAHGVTVEESFTVGAYQIEVLSATGAGGLLDWLDAWGFDLPQSSLPVLNDYIQEDFYFLAARVTLSEVPAANAYLSPLQLRYSSESFTLPIRIGTTVSTGRQEVILTVLNRGSEGKTSIANYPQAPLEDECMIPQEVVGYGSFYEEQLQDAFSKGIWVEEYSWSLGSCDPCSAEPPTPETLTALGVDWTDDDTWITRIRARYTPEQATTDLALYQSGLQESSQVKYVLYDRYMENYFPVCGVGMVEDPEACPSDSGDPSAEDSGKGFDTPIRSACGCSTSSSPLPFLPLLALLFLRRKSCS
ncbi:MAG TPA: DUF2330 domain-containing protein [Myxococcota bacterium]|nr:DUF2330 domain-containing protein [Myxococcota bacterium]